MKAAFKRGEEATSLYEDVKVSDAELETAVL